jgi:hypothetical protein
MSVVTVPTYTANAAGNVRASATLAAAGTDNKNLDYSAVFEGQLHIKNTPGPTVSSVRGLKIEVFRRFGSGPTTAASPMMTFYLPSTTGSTAESLDIFLPTGKWNVKITNLDASLAITVEMTDDTVSALTGT